MIVSLLSGIIRNARNRRAAKKAQTEALNSLSDQQAQLDNIFNNEYYGDYMNRSDVQSMMRSMQDQMRQQNAQNYNMAAVTCATPEAIAAQQKNNAETIGNTYSAIAANGAQWKNNVLNNYINHSAAINDKRYNTYMNASNMFRNASENALQNVGRRLENLDNTILSMAQLSSGMLWNHLSETDQKIW